MAQEEQDVVPHGQPRGVPLPIVADEVGFDGQLGMANRDARPADRAVLGDHRQSGAGGAREIVLQPAGSLLCPRIRRSRDHDCRGGLAVLDQDQISFIDARQVGQFFFFTSSTDGAETEKSSNLACS